ncbi:MAG: hypothetical protein AAF466_07965 [Bacteroidota bacterium]
MEETNTQESKETKKDPLAEARNAPLEASKTKNEAATKAITDNKDALGDAQAALTAANKIIDENKEELNALEKVKTSSDEINRAANSASTLAESVAGDAIAQSITDAAKAVKAALDSIEVAFPEASAMLARVDSVDKDYDTGATRKIVVDYVDGSKSATDAVEQWKKSAVALAIDQTDFLNNDMVDAMAGMADIVAAATTVATDVDTTTTETQTAIADAQKAAAAAQTTLDGLELQNLQSKVTLKSGQAFDSALKDQEEEEEETSSEPESDSDANPGSKPKGKSNK